MKVLSSDIQLSSRSQYFHSREETDYALDADKRVTHKTRNKILETREKTDSAHFKTQGDYTLDIRQNHNFRESVQKTTDMERGGDFDDDLEKNLYLASVFEWAAEAIDTIVAHFEDRKQAFESNQAGALKIRGDASAIASEILLAESKDINISSTDLSLSMYKEVAREYRLKAESLRPIAVERSDNRISRIKRHEIEDTRVQAGGVVQTADGRTIDFSITMGMHRENKETKTETYRLVDPLVINFSDTSAQLTSDKLEFDLDGDGDQEEIARLHEGSGYLALDLNQDGEVSSGRELFGPSTGNGFQELALYDNDKNGWIDENDPIYDKLKVWIQNDSEKGVLEKLSETGIGAIHLGAVDSEFLLEDSDGRAAGKVASTGVALTEDGRVKTIQQVDLMV